MQAFQQICSAKIRLISVLTAIEIIFPSGEIRNVVGNAVIRKPTFRNSSENCVILDKIFPVK